jgi:hypothetical protein
MGCMPSVIQGDRTVPLESRGWTLLVSLESIIIWPHGWDAELSRKPFRVIPLALSHRRNARIQWTRPEVIVLAIPALAKLLLHLFAANGYGFNGDELYYLACSEHLDWGYVDQPPLSILLLSFQRVALGDSMLSIRLLPAIAGALTVFLTGLLARRMGAAPFGQLLAGVSALVAPAYLAVHHMFSMNAFDVLFWTSAVYLIVCILDGGKPSLWLCFGLIVGLGFENKISILFLCFGIAVGLLLTKERKILLSRCLLAGAALALLLMLPNIIWQVTHGWPTLEFMANAKSKKMIALSPLSYLAEQLMLMQPATLLLWGTGLIALLFLPALSRYRAFGWCYLAILGVFIMQGGKPYYLIPIYPVLFAAGSITLERLLTRPWRRSAAVVVLLALGTVTAPLGLPLLPVDDAVAYIQTLGMRPSSGERYAEGRLPSFFANMFGWEKLAATVDTVYRSLPPEDRSQCGVLGMNYMQAGAIDFYGRKYDLPPAIAGHNSYYMWGTHGYSGDVVIVMGSSAKSLYKYFEQVTECARFRDENIQPIHNDLPIFIARRPKVPLESILAAFKEYI